MTIGEHHPYKLIDGRLHRLCYRNKWIDVTGSPMDWRHYEGQQHDEQRPPGKLYRYYRILIKDTTNGTANEIQQKHTRKGR